MPDFPAPDIDPDESNYAHCQVSEELSVPADAFFDWYMKEPIENFMLGTLVVSPVTGVEPLSDKPFGEVGSARLIHFKDGTIARERVLTNDLPRQYSYQPYGYNNPMHLLADYAKATMRIEPHGEGSRVIWDYAFHAKNKAALPLVKLFVKLDWNRNLTGALKIIKHHLEHHGPTVHIHAVAEGKAAA